MSTQTISAASVGDSLLVGVASASLVAAGIFVVSINDEAVGQHITSDASEQVLTNFEFSTAGSGQLPNVRFDFGNQGRPFLPPSIIFEGHSDHTISNAAFDIRPESIVSERIGRSFVFDSAINGGGVDFEFVNYQNDIPSANIPFTFGGSLVVVSPSISSLQGLDVTFEVVAAIAPTGIYEFQLPRPLVFDAALNGAGVDFNFVVQQIEYESSNIPIIFSNEVLPTLTAVPVSFTNEVVGAATVSNAAAGIFVASLQSQNIGKLTVADKDLADNSFTNFNFLNYQIDVDSGNVPFPFGANRGVDAAGLGSQTLYGNTFVDYLNFVVSFSGINETAFGQHLVDNEDTVIRPTSIRPFVNTQIHNVSNLANSILFVGINSLIIPDKLEVRFKNSIINLDDSDDDDVGGIFQGVFGDSAVTYEVQFVGLSGSDSILSQVFGAHIAANNPARIEQLVSKTSTLYGVPQVVRFLTVSPFPIAPKLAVGVPTFIAPRAVLPAGFDSFSIVTIHSLGDNKQYIRPTIILPPSFNNIRPTVQNKKRFITVPAYNDGKFTTNIIPEPSVSNIDRTLGMFGYVQTELPRFLIFNAARAIIPQSSVFTLYGATQVTHENRQFVLGGIKPSLISNWHEVYNSASAITTQGADSSEYGNGASFTVLRKLVFARPLVNKSVFGTTFVAYAQRTVGVSFYKLPQFPRPYISQSPLVIAPAGFDATKHAAPYIEERFTIIDPFSIPPPDFQPSNGTQILNRNRELVFTGITHTVIDRFTELQLFTRYVEVNSTIFTRFGLCNVRDRTQIVSLTQRGIVSLAMSNGAQVENLLPDPPFTRTILVGQYFFINQLGEFAEFRDNAIRPDSEDFFVERFGVPTVRTNAIRPKSIFKQGNPNGTGEGFFFGEAEFRAARQIFAIGIATKNDLDLLEFPDPPLSTSDNEIVKPRFSPHTIWAVVDAPIQAQINHPTDLLHEVDKLGRTGWGGGNVPTFGRAYVELKNREIKFFYIPVQDNIATVIGQHEVINQHRTLFIESLPVQLLGFPVLKNGVQFINMDGVTVVVQGVVVSTTQGSGFDSSVISEQVVAGYAPPFDVEIRPTGLNGVVSQELTIELFNRDILPPTILNEQKWGTAWISRSPRIIRWCGDSMTLFSEETRVEHTIRYLCHEGTDFLRMQPVTGFFRDRMRVTSRLSTQWQGFASGGIGTLWASYAERSVFMQGRTHTKIYAGMFIKPTLLQGFDSSVFGDWDTLEENVIKHKNYTGGISVSPVSVGHSISIPSISNPILLGTVDVAVPVFADGIVSETSVSAVTVISTTDLNQRIAAAQSVDSVLTFGDLDSTVFGVGDTAISMAGFQSSVLGVADVRSITAAQLEGFTGESFGDISATFVMFADGVDSVALGSTTVSSRAYVAPDTLGALSTFGNVAVSMTIAPAGLFNEVFGSPQNNVTIQPAGTALTTYGNTEISIVTDVTPSISSYGMNNFGGL